MNCAERLTGRSIFKGATNVTLLIIELDGSSDQCVNEENLTEITKPMAFDHIEAKAERRQMQFGKWGDYAQMCIAVQN